VWVNGENGRGLMWSMYLVYVYKNRTIKPIEFVLRSEEGDEGK
jgi:hypothetical protein